VVGGGFRIDADELLSDPTSGSIGPMMASNGDGSVNAELSLHNMHVILTAEIMMPPLPWGRVRGR
jgi:hypothetical protein